MEWETILATTQSNWITWDKGPPKVSFTWRHWADWTGEYNGNPGTGERLELIGMCAATVDEQLKITDLQVYFDPNPMLARMTRKNC